MQIKYNSSMKNIVSYAARIKDEFTCFLPIDASLRMNRNSCIKMYNL